MKLKMIPCKVCKRPMPELRLTEYNYQSCVECSTVGAYQTVNTTQGSGDHTWNDIQIMSKEQYDLYQDEVNPQPRISFGIENKTKK